MALIVQKYGGSSVGSIERIQTVAQRVKQSIDAGNTVVVVVSAMGKTTDKLIIQAKEISPNPSRREMDMLLATGEQISIALLTMALQELQQPAVSLTGAQVGIITEAEHTKARILHIKTDRIKKHLQSNKVVVVAGFQGVSIDDNLEITTLGRGGSDTSAVALAAALQAELCEIYTDVIGILTTDPRIVADAQWMEEITCDEMLELASLGAKVLHPRAVEISRNYGVPLVVRSSWTDDPGTRVTSPPPKPRSLQGLEVTKAVDGIEWDTNQAKVALLQLPDFPGVAAKIFGEIARCKVDVDLIIQSIHEGNTNDIAFTVVKNALNQAQAVAEAVVPALAATESPSEAQVMVDKKVAKVAIAGAGIVGRPGIAAAMFKALADEGINIQMISSSEVKVSCVIDEEEIERAVNALKKTFDVEASNVCRIPASSTVKPVRGVALDEQQAEVAIRYLPDKPGMAAQIFGALAKENISVGMIIQSQRCRIIDGVATRDIAFTVARGEADNTQSVLNNLANTIGYKEVLINKEIAKVSIVGAGMVENPGIAAQFFAALAREGINIQMIATSEIKVSCLVSQDNAHKALQVVHRAFDLGVL